MDGTTALSALSSVLTTTVKIAEKAFEISAVNDQAKNLLQTVNQLSGQLKDARSLRRQKSALLTTFEKRMFEDTFKHTDTAIRGVATIAERARADMDVSGGCLRVSTRLLFVLRDSPGIQTRLTQLGIASQGLNSVIMILSSREGRSQILLGGDNGSSINLWDSKPPPNYGESEFLSVGRLQNLRRRESAMAMNEQSRHSSHLDTKLPATGAELAADIVPKDNIVEPFTDITETGLAPYEETFDLEAYYPTPVDPSFSEKQQRRPRRGRARSQQWIEERSQ